MRRPNRAGVRGYVDKHIGDCVMASFGAPVAYGDDAALAILKSVSTLPAHRISLHRSWRPE
jgi:class 3 adenylate cyclase